ncbi:MAG: hypothetical protein VCC00_10260 [Deltaproteobacteria bacterium]
MLTRTLTHSLLALTLLAACGGSDPDDGSGTDVDLLGKDSPTCTISRERVLNPRLTTRVPGGKKADLCDFGVFAWESFLYLVAPSDADPSLRRFQSSDDFPQYLGQGEDSCGSLTSSGPFFKATNVAAPSPSVEAGTDSVVYSVHGAPGSGDNLILYNIRFSRDLCTAEGPNLPADLVEIKTAWRALQAGGDHSRYFVIDVEIDGVETKLGLIGFHLAQITKNHPEMVWSTWEHIDNVPDCVNSDAAPPRPRAGWTMTSDACASCLVNPESTDCSAACTTEDTTFTPATSPINQGWSITGLTDIPLQAAPTNICRIYPQGTRADDNQADTNRQNINELNDQVIGPEGYLSSLPRRDPQSVWQHYQLVGGIWFNAEGSPELQPDSNPDLQRGSIQLENTVMETTFQSFAAFDPSTEPTQAGLNCFTCHNAQDWNETLASKVSHIAPYVHGDTPD